MPSYPIRLSVPSSLIKRRIFGSILREYATRIENFLNARSQTQPVSVFGYHEISAELGIEKEIIKTFLAPKGGGSNGITIKNSNLIAKLGGPESEQ